MRSIPNTLLAALVFLTSSFLLAQTVYISWSEAEQEIWALEHQYMANIQNGNFDGLDPVWHDGFLGWPSHSARPVDRSGTIASLEELAKTTDFLAFELQPHALRITGNVAIVHYTVILDAVVSGRDRVRVSYRIVHTWLEEDGQWRILGGMSAEVSASDY